LSTRQRRTLHFLPAVCNFSFTVYSIQSFTIQQEESGQYLQACVWYGFLFGKPTSAIKSVPQGITPEDAVFLRATAQKDLDANKK